MELPFVLKTSRRSFIFNYLVGFGLLAYLFFSDAALILPTELTVFFVILISVFFIEPELILLYSSYHLKKDNVLQVKGYIAKKKVAIPYSSISNVILQNGIIGRIFSFGDIKINSFSGKEDIILRGIKHPEKILNLIEGIRS
jgi:membrane protein YdbS with pleckstrin-like domain